MNKKQKAHQSVTPGNGLATTVIEGDISYALKTWKRKVKRSGILNELKDRREFEKPSVTRRKEKKRAIFYNVKNTRIKN